MSKHWSIESALGNRQVVTKVDAESVQPDPSKLKDGWLIFKSREGGEIIAAFSRDTLLSAVIVEYEAEATVRRFRDSELLGKVRDLGVGGIHAEFTSIDDAIEQMTSYIKEVSGE